MSDKKSKIIPNYTTAALVERLLLNCAEEYEKPKSAVIFISFKKLLQKIF